MPASGTAFGPDGKKRLGPYEILSPLGAGGMGEVYLATDTRLERTVAIKVLPEHLSSDPQRRERFEREAKVVSSLNHPHICILHDIGEEDGTHFIVMEYVEGETLERRLEKGKLELDEALEYGIQITDALDRAHRKGVVHRDLKPGNIMLTGSGVKLLDFGLAKLKPLNETMTPQSQIATEDPQKDLTVEGTILGTVQYMAPEQLEGKDADARSDIFALGNVVYEMVTGRKTFSGSSHASLITAIMSQNPEPLATLEPMAPKALNHFIQTCLEKDGEKRWQTAHDAKVQLKWIREGEDQLLSDPQGVLVQRIVEAQVRAKTRHILQRAAVAVLVLIAATILAVWSFRNQGTISLIHSTVSAPPNEPVDLSGTSTGLSISPNGNLIVWSVELDGEPRLYLKGVGEPDGAILQVGLAGTPFFSPDSESIGFHDLTDNSLKMISTRPGARPEPIGQLESGTVLGADWGPDGNVIIATSDNSTGLVEFPAPRSQGQILTTPGDNENHLWPDILPNGQFVLFTIRSGYGNTSIAILDLRTGIYRDLLLEGTRPRYADTGHLVYAVGTTLRAIAFDGNRGIISNGATSFQVAEGLVSTTSGAAPYDFSDGGSLVFVWGEPLTDDRILAWVDREDGSRDDIASAEAKPYLNPRLSPDGTRVAVQTLESGQSDVWIHDLAGNSAIRQLTLEGNNVRPLWRPSEETVTFASDRTGVWGIYSQSPDGAQATLLVSAPEAGAELWPESWSPDGSMLAYIVVSGEDRAIWTATFDGDEPMTEEFHNAEGFLEGGPMFSPDGERLAFYSSENGDYNIFVHTVPTSGLPYQVTSTGGVFPLWLAEELVYRQPQLASSSEGTGLIARAVIPAGDQLDFSNPRQLPISGYATVPTYRNYDVAEDESRFLTVFPADSGSGRWVHLVQNWFQSLLDPAS